MRHASQVHWGIVSKVASKRGQFRSLMDYIYISRTVARLRAELNQIGLKNAPISGGKAIETGKTWIINGGRIECGK